jgi:ABC-type branched-subunit amino acid transport system substrate-binding protein
MATIISIDELRTLEQTDKLNTIKNCVEREAKKINEQIIKAWKKGEHDVYCYVNTDGFSASVCKELRKLLSEYKVSITDADPRDDYDTIIKIDLYFGEK